jgi:hypothetical protein
MVVTMAQFSTVTDTPAAPATNDVDSDKPAASRAASRKTQLPNEVRENRLRSPPYRAPEPPKKIVPLAPLHDGNAGLISGRPAAVSVSTVNANRRVLTARLDLATFDRDENVKQM